jgi:hypothetical protein
MDLPVRAANRSGKRSDLLPDAGPDWRFFVDATYK